MLIMLDYSLKKAEPKRVNYTINILKNNRHASFGVLMDCNQDIYPYFRG